MRVDDSPHRNDVKTFLFIVFQLFLLALIIRQFRIESSAFLRITLLAFGGFAIHYFLPFRHRLAFFALLSLLGIVVVFGFPDGLWLIGIGFGLIGLCHFPAPFWTRVLLLVSVALFLATLRVDMFDAPWSVAIWPILASMFVFRLIVYMYYLKHADEPVSAWRTIGYFFLLPNVLFPLFPVVDYSTFRRNYYDTDRHAIYQTGVDWMARGLLQLVLYRYIYYYIVISPSDVVDPDSLIRFLVSNFLLYLRISGYFHLVIGMLHLFGFRLPETNHHYCLASSFTEFWRRINIYWKDFMMKVFYYPVYFRIRNFGTTKALVLATLFAFAVTWFLHSYQWFWLRGTFPILWQDAVFWGILALLVICNSLYEMHFGRKRTLGAPKWTVRESMWLGLRTVGTFLTIIVLWSLWTTQSFASWLALWSFIGEGAENSSQMFPTLFLVLVVVLFTSAVIASRSASGRSKVDSSHDRPASMPRAGSLKTAVTLLLFAAIGLPQVYDNFDSSTASLIVSLRQDRLSPLDAATLQRGYYEDLTRVDRFNSQLWEVYAKKPLDWLDVRGSGLVQFTDGFLRREMIPSFRSVTPFSTMTTNRWGMRDRDYERTPPPGAYRIAVLGASSVTGWGVEDNETFEAILERKLNQQHAGKAYDSYELLNMSVPGYFPVQQPLVAEKAFGFEVDALFYIATGGELRRNSYDLYDAMKRGAEIPYQRLREILVDAGVNSDMDETTFARRLMPYQERILSWVYEEIAQRSREQDVLPVWVYLPHTAEGSWQAQMPRARALAEAAGFLILDLSDIYEDYDPPSLWLVEWDTHPNAFAHGLIASGLYDAMLENENHFFLSNTKSYKQN